ncbi:MAG: hypothetical protein D6689_18145 [Deltaproteobacteria bacterium]|nr:MAG: hypothetical protein D6689_18145 [Deltaproteobacteria bacterium]
MRILTASFVSPDEFLCHLRDAPPERALFYRSRGPLADGEPVVVDVTFPGLPNRALVRGTVRGPVAGRGAWIVLDEADASTCAFLLRLARGDSNVDPLVSRQFDRFPADLPVECDVERADGGGRERILSRTVDVGAGGAFVRAVAIPPVGSRVTLAFPPAGRQGIGPIRLSGEVAWTRRAAGPCGFAVRFADRSAADARALRSALRRASETGRATFATA